MPSTTEDARSDRLARASSAHGFDLRRSLIAFAVLSTVLVACLYADRLPAPVYRSQDPHPRESTLAVTAGAPLELELRLKRGVRAIRVPVWTEPGRRALRVSVWTATDGSLLAEHEVTERGVARLRLEVTPEQADALVLRFASDAVAERDAPRVMWAKHRPRHDAVLLRADRPIDRATRIPQTGPLIVIEYAWPTRYLLLGWPLLVIPFALAWRDPKRTGAFLVALGLAATLSSALLWQRDYSRRAAHIDADQYARSATELALYLSDAAARDAVRDWFRDYPHSTSMGVPALMAIPVALGAPVLALYMLLAAWAGFLCLLLFHRLLQATLALDHPGSLVATLLFGTHLLMLRSFARPVTDVFGLLLVLATLWMVLRRLQGVRPRDEVVLGLLLLAHPLTRPQGLAYWPFVALAVAACDAWRERGERSPMALWTSMVVAQLRLFAPALLLLAGLYSLLGWMHNLPLMMEKASRFQISSTLPVFLRSAFGVLQLLPLLWLGGLRRWREPPVLLFAAWLAYNVALLGVVDAPFWMRHFLPILPTVVLLSALGLPARGDRARQWVWGGVAVIVVWNVGATIAQALHFGPLPPLLEGIINTP
jgi:hypothetical protein